MTATQTRGGVYRALIKYPLGATIGELAERAGLPPAAVQSALTGMCSDGLARKVDRSRYEAAAPTDRGFVTLQTGLPQEDRPTRWTVKCGTRSGYQRHRRADEQACPECRAAEAAHAKARRGKSRHEDTTRGQGAS